MSKASEEFLDKLHSALAEELLRRIQDGTATAADLSAARQFLKDNGIDAVPKAGNPINNLMNNLPFENDDHSIYN